MTLAADWQNGVFVVDSIPTEGAEGWLATITIAEGETSASGEFVTFIWPRSPELPTIFAFISLLLPATLAVGVLLTYRAAGLKVVQKRQMA